MSIGFEFSARTRHKETLVQEVQRLAETGGRNVQEGENGLWISFCPMGGITLNWERENGLMGQWRITGECYSTPSGPGFHKAAIDFVEALGTLKNLNVSDETGYAGHRDFQRMREEHFLRWLRMLVNLCRERLSAGDYSSLCLCWDLDQYQPEDIPGTVITPMGRFEIQSMVKAVDSLGIGWLADRFFVWNRPEKDAVYYRNCALNQLWETCRFAPSGRSSQDAACNRSILDGLERAYRMDSRLPLPMEAYGLLCRLDGREPLIPDTVPELETQYPVGFCRSNVTYGFGVLRLTLPGNYLHEWEEQENGCGCDLWWDGTSEGGVWRVNGYRLQEGEASLEGGFDGLKDLEDLSMENGRARWGWSALEDEDEPYFQIFCKAVSGPSMFLMTVTYPREEQRDDIYGLLRKLKAVEDRKVETQTESYD